MHIFDIGNIAGNGTGYSFMAAQCFRLVEELRRLSENFSGSRFLRGLNTPGGLLKDLSPENSNKLHDFLVYLKKEFTEIIRVADNSASLANRLAGTGTIPLQVATDYGATGLVARSCGLQKDVRIDHPYAAYGEIVPRIQTMDGGDVDARFRLRIKEIFESIKLIQRTIETLPRGPVKAPPRAIPSESCGISLVEGWRGQIAYVLYANHGAVSRVKVRDPSFIHWQLASHISSQDMVPDFPLINKSLDLSYSGNDL
jgi:Ni,Fe-hydrogenase III large subunit